MHRHLLSFVLCASLVAASALAYQSKSTSPRVTYITYAEARPVLEALAEVLPEDLKSAGSKDLPEFWSKWVSRRDAEIRARLVQGNEDSLVNLLLFGTSFTSRPRITLKDLANAGEHQLMNNGNTSPEAVAFLKLVQSRTDDLINRLYSPGNNERLLFARQLLTSKGIFLISSGDRENARRFVLGNLARVLAEHASYARVLESARQLGDPSAEFAERSKLYSNRGLSSDTSLFPDFAVERALSSLKTRGLLAAGSVRRVGIIGPGLDFADKQDGYDFYPQQTIQPFAVIDSLLRLGLTKPSDLSVMTFDLNPRVNDHLHRAIATARKGAGYTIQLPRDLEGQWKPDVIDYWGHFGDKIGVTVAPVSVPEGIGAVKLRAIRVRPSIVTMVSAEDTNIVLQSLASPTQQFDLLIATNILVYYDVFEQCLALLNIEKMLRPGGFLLSNNALLELPGSAMHSVGYDTVVYSDRPNDGDHIVWYQRRQD
jgi:hypothetical protein